MNLCFVVRVKFIEDIDYLLTFDVLRLGLRWRKRCRPDPQHCLWNPVAVPLDNLMRGSAIVLLYEFHILDINHLDRILTHQAILTFFFVYKFTWGIQESARVLRDAIMTSIEGKLLRILILQTISQVASSWMLILRYFYENVFGYSDLIRINFYCSLLLMFGDLFFLFLLLLLI